MFRATEPAQRVLHLWRAGRRFLEYIGLVLLPVVIGIKGLRSCFLASTLRLLVELHHPTAIVARALDFRLHALDVGAALHEDQRPPGLT